ncbi:MAG TPA: IclR family transcriptional regulator [Acidimicrobiales bacterium]|nr:IclR family transcriptional regulator [Acidimicrobiales bacterium]
MTSADHFDGRGSQTLARGVKILRALQSAPEGLSVADLVRAVGLHRSIVTRLLTTLEEEHFVERTRTRAYRLGLGLIALGKAVRADLRDLSEEALTALAGLSGATAVLVLRDGAHAVVVSVVEPLGSDLRLLFRLGSRHPLEQGAEGMAILAGNPPREGERPEVTRAREAGYVVSEGEIMPGTWGLAVPVMSADSRSEMSVGVIAAQALDEAKTFKLVKEVALSLQARLDWADELR